MLGCWVPWLTPGNIKDIVVVCMSAFLIGEPTSSLQILGFSTQVLCVFAWTSYKHNGQLVPKAPGQKKHHRNGYGYGGYGIMVADLVMVVMMDQNPSYWFRGAS
jgi:hypothetical protein